MTILKRCEKTKIQKPWYKSDSAYLYASYINYNKNQCAGKHTQATQFFLFFCSTLRFMSGNIK